MDVTTLGNAADSIEREIRQCEARIRANESQLQAARAELEELRGTLVALRKLMDKQRARVGVTSGTYRMNIAHAVGKRLERLGPPKQGPRPTDYQIDVLAPMADAPPQKPAKTETTARFVEREIEADPGCESGVLARRLAPHMPAVRDPVKLVFSTISYLIQTKKTVERRDGKLYPVETTAAPNAESSEAAS